MVELEIVPEPPPEEREAVEAAIVRALDEPREPRSLWRLEGIRENVLAEADD